MDVFKKIKCVRCGYEMASKAKRPQCKCGSRKFNPIDTFTQRKQNQKPQPIINSEATKNMAKEKPTQEQKQTKQEEEYNFERDLELDDDEKETEKESDESDDE